MKLSPHLSALESQAIHIIRDAYAEAQNPVVLFSGGKDSTVLAHLVVRAFFPSRRPVPLLHIDSTWDFADVLSLRDDFARNNGFELIVHASETGRQQGINPFEHGEYYVTAMRTEALKRGMDAGGHDVIFGGTRRDEEATRAKERIVLIATEN